MANDVIAGGYAGRVLAVDLTTGRFEETPLDPGQARLFLGAQGLNTKVLYDQLKRGTDPLSPENILVFGAGALVGTMAPMACKTSAGARSPLTGLLGFSNTGHLGAALKYAGYDQIIIKGKALQPVYLRIQNDAIQLVPASDLWGKDTFETTDALWQKLGQRYDVAAIGQAGEHLVHYAAILVNKFSPFGRTGMGAVMGSKNLKAVAISGSGGIRAARPGRFMKAVNRTFKSLLADHENVRMWREYGSRFGGLFFTYKNNLRRAHDLDLLFNPARFLEGFERHNVACAACPVGCKMFLKSQGGKGAGLAFTASCTSSTLMGPFGQSLRMSSMADIARSCRAAQRYGLDVMTLDSVIKLAVNLHREGVISDDEAGDLNLQLGWADILGELMRRIAYREGIGDVLADGVAGACRRIGRNAESYYDGWHVKGLPELPEAVTNPWTLLGPHIVGEYVNARGAHGDGFRYPAMVSVSARGADEKVRPYLRHMGVPEEAAGRILASDSPQGYNVPMYTRYVEDFNLVLQGLGICDRDMSRQQAETNPGIEMLAELYASATGLDVGPAELLKAGERMANLQRLFNMREGATRRDDLPSRAVFEIEVESNDGKKHPPLTLAYVNSLLDEYYRARGWDVATGMPPQALVRELGLDSDRECQ